MTTTSTPFDALNITIQKWKALHATAARHRDGYYEVLMAMIAALGHTDMTDEQREIAYTALRRVNALLTETEAQTHD